MPLQSQESPACSSSGNGCACKGQASPETATPFRQAAVASSKRGFLQDLIAVAASFGLASTARAALPGDPSFQPERRPGMEGKRFGMLVDMRKCIGCQACTVSCSVENQPPIGQFRTTVLQYEVDKPDNSMPAMVSLPRLCNHCDEPPFVPVCPGQATFQLTDGIVR